MDISCFLKVSSSDFLFSCVPVQKSSNVQDKIILMSFNWELDSCFRGRGWGGVVGGRREAGYADLFLCQGGVRGCEEVGLKVLLLRLGSEMSLLSGCEQVSIQWAFFSTYLLLDVSFGQYLKDPQLSIKIILVLPIMSSICFHHRVVSSTSTVSVCWSCIVHLG